MRITFDPSFDHGYWPGPLEHRDAVAGEMWVGLSGLLGALETSLGLGGPVVSNAERAAGLLAEVTRSEGFWSRSAEADVFGTTHRLLLLRDELVLAGWQGQPLTERLAQLARVTSTVRPGVADRVAAVEKVLRLRRADIECVEIIEPVADLASLWTRVLDALFACGTEIIRRSLLPADASGDLRAARGKDFEPALDGSLQMLRPYGELAAADETAAWLAAHADRGRVVVIGSDPVLDAALRRHGLPTTGAEMSQGDNSLLALIPLVLAMGWDPPDPEQVLGLLSLPVSPVPPGIASRLRRALSEVPAVGSAAWNAALAEGLQVVEDDKRRDALTIRIASLFKAVGARNALYPASEVTARLDVLVQWLQRRLGASARESGQQSFDTQPWLSALQAAGSLSAITTASRMEALSAPQLRRFTEQALDNADGPRMHGAQAGIAAIGQPGAMVGVADLVIWWSFRADSAPRVSKLPLMPAERAALAQADIHLRDARQMALCRSQRWARPLMQTTRGLVLVAPRGDAESARPHPLWDEVIARMRENGLGARLITSTLRGVEIARHQRERLRAPVPQRTFHVPVERLEKRERWSPSALGTLLGCSFKWVLDYPAHLRPSNRLPDGSLLYGRIAHEILAAVFKTSPSSPDQAHQRALQIFDDVGPRLSATLFLPGTDGARAEVRQVCADAARDLARIMQDAGLKPISLEQTYERDALGAKLSGKPDMVLGPSPAVIDLKWGGLRRRREELETGTAYQLAAYSLLVGESDQPTTPVGYYILSTKQLVTTAQSQLGGMQVRTRPLRETWDALDAAFKEQWSDARLGAGIVHAQGNADDDHTPVESSAIDAAGKLRLEPPCTFCNHAVLCGAAFEVAK